MPTRSTWFRGNQIAPFKLLTKIKSLLLNYQLKLNRSLLLNKYKLLITELILSYLIFY